MDLRLACARNRASVERHRPARHRPGGTATGAPAADQRGVARDAQVDIGAYEYVGTLNQAPTLDTTKSPALTAQNEDSGAPSGAVGTLVSSLVDFAVPAGQVDNVTDPDGGALLGIAVTAADTANGSWWYSINGGTNWLALGAVASNSARLLAADGPTRLYLQPTANWNGTLASAITFRAWDQTTGSNGAQADTTTNGGTTAFSTATDTAALSVTAVNDAPVVTTTGSTLAYTENAAATTIDSGLTAGDIDSANLTGATVTISADYASGQDVLAFTNQLGITGSWSSVSGVMTLTGTTTVANYQAALRTVTYVNTSDNPSTLARTASFVVNDGAANSSAATRAISVTAVNDAPVNTVPGAQGSAVNTPKVLSAANGNAISISDADAGAASAQVQLTATNGTLTLAGTSGLTFSVGDGVADVTMTFTAPMTTINAGLDGMSFSPTPDWAGAAGLQIVTNDLGNTGAGGPLTDSDTVAITITNTPPTGVADSYTVLQNNGLLIATPGVLGNDTDPDPQTLSVGVPRPLSWPSHGSLTLNADGSFSYTPDTNWSGTDAFTYLATDGLAASAATTVTITVTDTAYTPSGTWPASFDPNRYLKVTFPAYVPAGSTVTGAILTHTYRSETAGDTTCYYFEVYREGTLEATHGSAGSPVSCNGSTGWVTDVVSLPEIDSVARANSLTIKMYVSNSGTGRSQHRLMTIGTTYYLD